MGYIQAGRGWVYRRKDSENEIACSGGALRYSRPSYVPLCTQLREDFFFGYFFANQNMNPERQGIPVDLIDETPVRRVVTHQPSTQRLSRTV